MIGVALTAAFVIIFFAVRIGLQDAARSIGSDRRARRARDRHIDRRLRDIDKR